MAPLTAFPALPTDWEDTRRTLHAQAQAVGAVARAAAPPQPHWWHISLEVDEAGLVSSPIPVGDGAPVLLLLDLKDHRLTVRRDQDEQASIPLDGGVDAQGFADRLFATMAGTIGVDEQFELSRVAVDADGTYDHSAAGVFRDALQAVNETFARHRESLPGDPGPIQLWPHGFDLAFEWFGSKIVEHDEDGRTKQLPAQLNLGWYPAGDAYFYSNPWPFDPSLVDEDLPHGAEWHTEGWQGTELAYSTLAGNPEGPRQLLDFAQRVFELARPTLSA